MQEQATKFQLRQMVLVNAGTNVRQPSARITSIDPRGGAAVLGDNGVGKTTTLRLIPLFFGHLASQIVAAGQGQDSMIRFVLPTDGSAIAFEYQRGSADDLRLAVIRRRADDPDVPVYRLYRCGFLKELFVADGRFLDDEATQRKATELGIQTSSKLTSAEYRSVILRTHASSKERDRLRRYSVEWSFGPRPLDNLDRLVAAMVKKHINFSDIVQVAVSFVQQDLGHGADGAKLRFKQAKEQIADWLRNRQACADAFKMAPRIEALERDLRELRTAETRLRARRADVVAVISARQQEKTRVRLAIEDLTSHRKQQEERQVQDREVLLAASGSAHLAALDAQNKVTEQQQKADYFNEQSAAHWETQVVALPQLHERKTALQEQLDVANAKHGEATAKYETRKNEARVTASNRGLELERDKAPHEQRLTEACRRIDAAEHDSLEHVESTISAKRTQLEAALEPLQIQTGGCQARKNAPAASTPALAALEEASQRVNDHADARSNAASVLSKAKADQVTAKHAFDAQERTIREAKQLLEAAGRSVEQARLRLAPNPGSLLATLRTHTDQAWKRALAKVIDPTLLEREDLDPQMVEEGGQTVYGWQLSIGAVAAPEWVDDELARRALDTAVTREAAAKQNVVHLEAQLADRGRELSQTDRAANEAQARVDILDGQSEGLKTAQAVARQRVDKEKREATVDAEAELARLKTAIEGIRQQQRGLADERHAELAKVRKAHEAQRQQAQHARDEAIQEIERNRNKVAADLEALLRDLDEQLAEHLSERGVDPKRLQELMTQVAELTGEVRKREEKQSLVAAWKQWHAEGGYPHLEELRAKHRTANATSQQAATRLSEFDRAAQTAREEYEGALNEKTKRLETIGEDLEGLAALQDEFSDYQAVGTSLIDVGISLKDLRAKVLSDKNDLNRRRDGITRQSNNMRLELTAKESSVRDLVEASMAVLEGADEVRRADELCTCYKQIGPQVASNINLTLKTLLANIGAFHHSLQSFEREVAAFNRRLQAGLSDVRCFERVKDLRLDIVTNFENLGFYKKLSRMDDIVRENAVEVGNLDSRDLPSDDTARALGDFVSVLGADGTVEVNLSSHITLKGSVTDNGQRKEFKRAGELENISSEGLTSLVLITLMTALLNTIRGAEPVYVPWVTDEVGKFDPGNFVALMTMLRDNRIDVVTASPELGSTQQAMFSHRYLFEDRGRIRTYKPGHRSGAAAAPQAAGQEVLS
jgi:hypothetical protein